MLHETTLRARRANVVLPRVRALRTWMVLLVLLGILPATGATVVFVWQMQDRAETVRAVRQADLLRGVGALVDRMLADALHVAAQATALPDGENPSGVARLADVARGMGLSLVLRDASGAALDAASGAAPLPADWLPPGGEATPRVTDALADTPSGRLVPHLLSRRRQGGVIDIGLAPERMMPMDGLVALLRPSFALLTDSAGMVIGGSDRSLLGRRLPDALRHLPEAGVVPAIAWPGAQAAAVRFATPQHAAGWRVSVWDPVGDAPFSPVAAWAATMMALFGITMLAVIALARRLAGPLQSLTDQARAAAGGGEMPIDRAPRSGVAEFETLRSTLARAVLVLRHRAATERRALREARDGQMLLASVINASADGIAVHDCAGQTILTNAAARDILAVVSPFDRNLRPLALDVQTNGGTRSIEIAIPGDAGAPRRIWLVKSAWRDGAGTITGVVTVMRDVTLQRRDEARLHALQADQAHASILSAMGVMAAGLAHDLNQPLAAASNFLGAAVRLLDRPAERDDALHVDRAREAVGEAGTQVRRAGEIVRALRTFLAEGNFTPGDVSVATLLADACAVARADGSLGTVRLDLACIPGDLMLRVDATQLRQVLLNLIRNAAEAVQDAASGVGLIRVDAEQGADGAIVITVGDSGPGIAREVAGRLFEPFVSTKRLGLGIGLAICRTIVEAHGGALTAGRAPDNLGGALFSITLPAYRGAGA